MVYLPPPDPAASRQLRSYGEAYNAILTAHRRSPLTSASSIAMLVAPDVDALCACRMLGDLFKDDDLLWKTIPVSGLSELYKVRDDMLEVQELHSLILLNMGGIQDLAHDDWFGGFNTNITIHIIDSARPTNLSSLFGAGENGDRIIVWDDGDADNLSKEQKAWEAILFAPESDSDADSDSDSDESLPDDDDDDDEGYENDAGPSRKRRSLGDANKDGKRRRTDAEKRIPRLSRDERDDCVRILNKYYAMGTWHGQGAAATIYILATVLERATNDLLWLAILGLTYQYSSARISREKYDRFQQLYHDEVVRLNPPPPAGEKAHISSNPDDLSIRTTEELRFMLFRHWTLYDAMFHSSYVASKLGIWQDKGRKKLTGLLAKMGFSIPQTQQPYPHMDMDLKRMLIQKLNDIAPEYGMVELSYPSFMRCFGYSSQPMSAADAVEGINALLHVAHGVRMEIEVEGARNGGEWFGGGKVWEAPGSAKESKRRRDEDRENVPPGGELAPAGKPKTFEDGEDGSLEKVEVNSFWVDNFWSAYDALVNTALLRRSLNLSMSLHRAIIRQGTSIIDKRDIRPMRSHHVVILSQGPDLNIFANPGVLSRLALWLVDALRDRMTGTNIGRRSKRKSLPFVVACLNETQGSYIVVGVTAALEFGDVRKNEFASAFMEAKERCNARTRHGTFDTSVLEIDQQDLKLFLDTLCEGVTDV